jgi:Uma2 family endonuclease
MDMAETVEHDEADVLAPDLTHLVTEDDAPVDNRYSERQMRLLSSTLFDSWDEGKPFEALTDVGLFSKPDNESKVVPDFLLSLGVEPREVSGEKEDRSYFVWLYGKPPNLVIEIVSNKEGGELDRKFQTYQKIGVAYYAVHDPFHQLGKRTLRLFRLDGGEYVECASAQWMPEIGLGLTLWEGEFQDVEAQWLRFVDRQGCVIPTAHETSEMAMARAAEESARATEADARAAESDARAAEANARAAEVQAKADEALNELELLRRRLKQLEADE